MKTLIFLTSILLVFNSFSQQDSISIKLQVNVVNSSGGLIDEAQVFVREKDSVWVELMVNNQEVFETEIDTGKLYDIEVKCINYLGNHDCITTKGIDRSIVISREILVLNETCQKRVDIRYEKKSLYPINILDTGEVIPFYLDYLNNNPNAIISITCFRSKNESKSKSLKRSQYIADKLIENNISSNRLILIDGGIKELTENESNFVSE
jgi:hypothetical protein